MGKLASILTAAFAACAQAVPSEPNANGNCARGAQGSSNGYSTVKNTGVTRTYDWTVTRQTVAPDGVSKGGILVNGQFPGPTLQANVGDTFQVTVRNQINSGEIEGTSLHWHGLLQRGSPWYDGTPASQICPIAPGDSFTYTFLADQAGSSWWHSHYSAQHVDGLKGPLIINGPTSAPYDVDLGPIFLSDWYHPSYEKELETVNAVPNSPVYPDSTLINGKGQFNCTLGKNCPSNTPYSKFNFQSGKTYLLRLINSSGDNYQCFAIDGHEFTVIAADFTPVKPYTASVISLHAAQRMDVLVKATGSPTSSYWMRSNVSGNGNLLPFPPVPSVLAPIYYEHADQNKFPTTTAGSNATCGVDPLPSLHPAQPSTPPSAPATTKTVNVAVTTNSTGHILWYQNGITFRGDYNEPVLLLAKTGNTSYPDPDWNVYNFGSNSSIRMIFYNTSPLIHPMHLHGHQPWILATGTGTWDGTIQNPSNPMRRDTQVMPAGTAATPGYMVIEWIADNPGVWGLHCHVSWHSGPGFFLNVLEQPAALKQLPISTSTATSLAQRCRNWWAFTNHEVVDQIDSGL